MRLANKMADNDSEDVTGAKYIVYSIVVGIIIYRIWNLVLRPRFHILYIYLLLYYILYIRLRNNFIVV